MLGLLGRASLLAATGSIKVRRVALSASGGLLRCSRPPLVAAAEAEKLFKNGHQALDIALRDEQEVLNVNFWKHRLGRIRPALNQAVALGRKRFHDLFYSWPAAQLIGCALSFAASQ